MDNPVLQYWAGIQSGEYVVSAKVRRQYQKMAGEINNPGQYIFDIDKAMKPIRFIERFCRHSKGEWAGKPIRLELFQRAFIAALFGFVDKDTGLRRYREAMFCVARKNGKTCMLSGLALYMLMADGEAGAAVHSIASKLDQAKLCFDETLNMVKQSPELSKHLRKRKTDLYFEATFSKFQPLGKNSNSLDGLNCSLCILDECHCLKDRNIYEVLKQSQSARRQPLFITISTNGTQRQNIFDDLYQYASNLIDGNFTDDTFLPVLYELDSKEEIWDESCWPKANPGIHIMKKADDLRQKVERAKNSPADLAGILCKDFNIPQVAHNVWMSFDDIKNDETFDLEQFRGAYCIGSADLSIAGDLTSAAILMLDKSGKRYVHSMSWLPRDTFLERVERDKIPYNVWKAQGLLRLCDSNTINYSDVTAWFLEIVNEHGITPLWIYYDSYSARYWVDEMEQHGFNMVRCIQGAKTLSLPLGMMGAELKAKKINYNNNPMMRWALSNLSTVRDRNNNEVPCKALGPKMKIDPAAAMLNCYVGLYDHLEEFARLAQ